MGMTGQTQGALVAVGLRSIDVAPYEVEGDSSGHKGSWYRGKQWSVRLQSLQLSS